MTLQLLPCFFKKFTGLDCPGCGFQRSVLELFKGNMLVSLSLYPATLLIIASAIILLIDVAGFIQLSAKFKRLILPINISIIGLSYIIKMISLYFI